MSEKSCRDTEWVCLSFIIVDWIRRWCQTETSPHCWCESRTVLMSIHCSEVLLASTAWLESSCRQECVLDKALCSAVECDDCSSLRPSGDLRCLLTSARAAWRHWMSPTRHRSHLLQPPTHTYTNAHRDRKIIKRTTVNNKKHSDKTINNNDINYIYKKTESNLFNVV